MVKIAEESLRVEDWLKSEGEGKLVIVYEDAKQSVDQVLEVYTSSQCIVFMHDFVFFLDFNNRENSTDTDTYQTWAPAPKKTALQN